jgi:hypothetical protein
MTDKYTPEPTYQQPSGLQGGIGDWLTSQVGRADQFNQSQPKRSTSHENNFDTDLRTMFVRELAPTMRGVPK